MDPRHIQMLLASAGYYRGAIDGVLDRLIERYALEALAKLGEPT